jgi:hypothetical protein
MWSTTARTGISSACTTEPVAAPLGGYADFSARRGLCGTMVGAALSSTAAFVTTTRATPVEDGTSNMIGPSTSYMMARSPRAPVWRSTARSAIACNAGSSKSSSTPSSSNMR